MILLNRDCELTKLQYVIFFFGENREVKGKKISDKRLIQIKAEWGEGKQDFQGVCKIAWYQVLTYLT